MESLNSYPIGKKPLSTTKSKKSSPTVTTLFAGGGGDTLGFVTAGFNLVFANDINQDACDTLRRRFENGKKIIHHGAVQKINKFVKSNVITGGFPCQGFSSAGPRNVDDKRNTLYRDLKRAIDTVKPDFFVAENVKGFVTLGEHNAKQFFKNGKIIKLGSLAQSIIDDLASIGYKVQYELHNARDFGIPQSRERIIIVGVRNDIDFEFKFPQPSHNEDDFVTMKELKINKIKVKDSEIYRESKGRRKDYFSSRYMSRNRIRKWNQLSYTIPAEASQVPSCPDCDKMWTKDKLNKRQISDDELVQSYSKYMKYVSKDLRRLSWRQCAAIQGFPLDYEFSGDLVSIYRQIGNAVPPKLMEKIAECLIPYYKGKKSSY